MLREYTTPITSDFSIDGTVYSILSERVARTPDSSLVEYKDDSGQWQSFSGRKFLSLVQQLAKGLLAKGVQKGDSIAIMAHTSWQWTALDIAIMSIGALTVPIYETNSAQQIAMIVNDANVSRVFVENDVLREKVEQIKVQAPQLQDIFELESGAIELLQAYAHSTTDEELQAAIDRVYGSDLATIVYTSGSTGTPKGVELTHQNFVYIARSGAASMPDIALGEGRRLLLFLPLAHVFARYMQFFCFAGDVTLGLSSNLKTIIKDFQSFKPTFVLAVPRIFEKVYNAASQKAGKGLRGLIFNRAAQVARTWSHGQQEGHIPALISLQHAIYSKLVYKAILDVFGGNVEYAVSGGAPLDQSIAHFFNGVGLPLLEGYGMTEVCAPACVNPTSGYKIGTIGIPLQGVSFAVAKDGELCIKSLAVCKGYHHHPELTAQQITDGWLHTGDLGSIDDEGFISITGRKKDLIITAGGKNVSPDGLQTVVMTSPVVAQCVVIGDRRRFVSALITIDLEDANAWLESNGAQTVQTLEQACTNPIIRAEVERVVDLANATVSRAESIRKYEILDTEFTEANGLLTPSLKAKRQVIEQRFADIINNKIYGVNQPKA